MALRAEVRTFMALRAIRKFLWHRGKWSKYLWHWKNLLLFVSSREHFFWTRSSPHSTTSLIAILTAWAEQWKKNCLWPAPMGLRFCSPRHILVETFEIEGGLELGFELVPLLSNIRGLSPRMPSFRLSIRVPKTLRSSQIPICSSEKNSKIHLVFFTCNKRYVND